MSIVKIYKFVGEDDGDDDGEVCIDVVELNLILRAYVEANHGNGQYRIIVVDND